MAVGNLFKETMGSNMKKALLSLFLFALCPAAFLLPSKAQRTTSPAATDGRQDTVERTADLSLIDLRCEYRKDPLGIDIPRPRLSWAPASDRRGQRQTAYRILVASTPEMLKDSQSLFRVFQADGSL